MREEIPMSRIMLWDRQDKKMYPAKDFHYNKEQDREYWKHKMCNCWVEDDCALDVFIMRENTNTLMKYRRNLHIPIKKHTREK